MSKTFSRPLIKRTDFSFKSGLDYRSIGEGRRRLFADNPLDIKPDDKLLVPCSMDVNCTNVYNPNTQTWDGTCLGTCMYG